MMENNQELVFGCLDTKDGRDYKLVAPEIELPESFSLDMPKIKNQWSVGSCVAHALSTILEYYACKEYHKVIELSTDYIYGNRENSSHKNSGMIIRDALKNARTFGDMLYSEYPLNTEVPEVIEKFKKRDIEKDINAQPYIINTFFSMDKEKDIKYNLFKNGPCMCSVTMYKYKIKDDVLIFDKEKPTGGSHAMVIYGWNEKGWLIQNSWGKTWGNKGTCILPYDTDFNSVWGVIDENSELQVIIKKPSEVMNMVYKLLSILMSIGYEFRKLFARGR